MGRWTEAAKKKAASITAAGAMLTDEQAVTVYAVFMRWAIDTAYNVGDRVRHGELLYRCLQAHTSQADWSPDVAVSLWVRIDDPAIAWPEWRQPLGGHDAYDLGAKVTHNDKRWVSIVDNNVWAPGAYGWEEVS